MRKRPGPGGHAMAVIALVSLCLSQFIVGVTHSSAGAGQASLAAVDHSADADHRVHEVHTDHDASDHEHQVNAIVARLPPDVFPTVSPLRGLGPLDPESVIFDGPRRPPRLG